MKLTDEQLQETIERGAEAGNDDGRAYRQVFAALRQPLDRGLSSGFEDAVMQKVLRQEARRGTREYVWYIVGVVLLLITTIIAVVMTGFRLNFGFLQSISAYSGIFIFGGLFMLFLHVLDRRLLHNRRV
jgi:hypothetical protein